MATAFQLKTNLRKAWDNALTIEDNVGQLQSNLKQLKAIKTELYELELDMENASGEGWNQRNSVMIIEDIERKITLVNLAMEAIYDQTYKNTLQTVIETSKLTSNLKVELEEKEEQLNVVTVI